MAKNGKNKTNGLFGDPTSQEVILGKKVDIGKGVGQKVGKRAKSAIEIRREKQRQALKGMFNG